MSENELRVFGSLADAKALLNERVWRTEINATLNESGYGTNYALGKISFPLSLALNGLHRCGKATYARSGCLAQERYRGRRCERRGGTVLPVAGGRKRKETATPEPEAAAAPKEPKTAG
jgi:hypothetical protein